MLRTNQLKHIQKELILIFKQLLLFLHQLRLLFHQLLMPIGQALHNLMNLMNRTIDCDRRCWCRSHRITRCVRRCCVVYFRGLSSKSFENLVCFRRISCWNSFKISADFTQLVSKLMIRISQRFKNLIIPLCFASSYSFDKYICINFKFFLQRKNGDFYFINIFKNDYLTVYSHYYWERHWYVV